MVRRKDDEQRQMNKGDLHKVTEYREQYRFWSDKRISQLSFHNNLLLTLGMAAVGYFWKEKHTVYTDLIIDYSLPIDWKVLFFITGIAILYLSIVLGFILALSRLFDLRLTAHIALTKQRLEKKGIDLERQGLSKANFLSSLKALCLVFWHYHRYNVQKAEIEANDKVLLQKKFTLLRQKSEDLGALTWILVKWQTLCMLVSMTLLIIVLLKK